MVIKNLKMLLILALLIFNTPFWLSIANQKKCYLQLVILALHCGSERRQQHVHKRTHTRERKKKKSERERERERERDGSRGVGVARLI
jgi:hypothetical protein